MSARLSLRWGRPVLVGVGALLAALVLSVAPAQARTFEVLNLNDSGPGSLRHAIEDANTTSGADTITFRAGVVGTITLITGQLSVSDDLTIDGPGATNLAISGAGATRVLEVIATTLQLKGVTVANGSVEHPAAGGGIFSTGTLAVTNTTFLQNESTGNGGAIFNNGGVLAVDRSTFLRNAAAGEGGAIRNLFGTVAVSDSTFAQNSASDGGGIATVNSVSLSTITNSTFSENTANFGGGIDNEGLLRITNSTFSRNAASGGHGGAIFNLGTLDVVNATFAANSAFRSGGAIANPLAGVTLKNALVASSPTGGNCSGSIADGGGNLSWPDTSCPGLNADPLLDASGLADNGGSTQTIALLPDSLAIDAAVAANCPETDQRGVIRPQGQGCDVGAFEALSSNPAAVIEDVLEDVQGLVDANPGTPLADKAEDVAGKLSAALAELTKTPPDGAAAIGNLEGAVGDLEAMGKDGLIDPDELIDTLTDAGKLLARQAIDDAVGKTAAAEQAFAEGEALQAAGQFKAALSKYKDAYSKAASG